MRDLVRKAMAFITFTQPLELAVISSQFISIHNNYLQRFQHWTFGASRNKLIADFWFRQTILHFSAIMLLGLVFSLPFQHSSHSLLVPVGIVTFFTALSLTIFNYFPTFYADFLPKLKTVIAEHEKLKFEASETRKCKRTQFSIPALIIIFYVFTKTGNMSMPAANDRTAELLNRLFGADKDKLKQNLTRLHKLSALSPKERAEILKGIDVSRSFFEALNFPNAQKMLDALEIKLQKTG